MNDTPRGDPGSHPHECLTAPRNGIRGIIVRELLGPAMLVNANIFHGLNRP